MVDFGQKHGTRWRISAEETKDSAAQGEEIWPSVKYAETTITCHLKLSPPAPDTRLIASSARFTSSLRSATTVGARLSVTASRPIKPSTVVPTARMSLAWQT